MKNPTNVIVIILLALVVGLAIFYIIKAKKSGKKCIGCPSGGSCASCKCCPSRSTSSDEHSPEEDNK